MKIKKSFVLDTNVLLHDYRSLYSFKEHDLYIPGIVLDEIDAFKKGNEEINYNAREVVRQIGEFKGMGLASKGVCLGEGMGKLYLVPTVEYAQKLIDAKYKEIPDHIILSTAMFLQEQKKKVVLVTKDINLRVKADMFGIEAEDYLTDIVKDPSKLYENIVKVKMTDEHSAQIFKNGIPEIITQEDLVGQFSTNQHVQIDIRLFARKIDAGLKVIEMKNLNAFGIKARNDEQMLALDCLLDPHVSLVAITGKAGTGKTLLAIAAALQIHQEYKDILLARPIVALSNKDLGFLPGDEKQKIAPYMQPLFDNLNVIKSNFNYQGKEIRVIEELQREDHLKIEALAYIRGRSLNDTYLIVDEAQNLTPHEVKTIVTRAGEGTKVILCGDPEQIDNPYVDSRSNGLVHLIDRMKGNKVFVHVHLTKGERSYLAEIASDLL